MKDEKTLRDEKTLSLIKEMNDSAATNNSKTKFQLFVNSTYRQYKSGMTAKFEPEFDGVHFTRILEYKLYKDLHLLYEENASEEEARLKEHLK